MASPDVLCPIIIVLGTLEGKLNATAVANRCKLQDLEDFRYGYYFVRPHANLGGVTPGEAWQGVDPNQRMPVAAEWFEEWDGLLTGFRMRR